jgi:hypothetical protein
MRTKVLFNNVDASISHTSAELDFQQQDARFLIQVVGTSLDGAPRFVVEESINGDIWTALEDTSTWLEYFEPSSLVIGIKDSYFMGKYMRCRIVPNGNTTGTIYAIIGYKTKV